MYSVQETSKQKQAFWTTFGRYMQPVPSADGEPVNWINYKTGVPGIRFKMDADDRHAFICIVLSHAEPNLQQRYYQQFLQQKQILHGMLTEEWEWRPLWQDETDKIVSTISKQLAGVNIHNKEDWPDIISFLKPRIMTLDEFWNAVRYGFNRL